MTLRGLRLVKHRPTAEVGTDTCQTSQRSGEPPRREARLSSMEVHVSATLPGSSDVAEKVYRKLCAPSFVGVVPAVPCATPVSGLRAMQTRYSNHGKHQGRALAATYCVAIGCADIFRRSAQARMTARTSTAWSCDYHEGWFVKVLNSTLLQH